MPDGFLHCFETKTSNTTQDRFPCWYENISNTVIPKNLATVFFVTPRFLTGKICNH